MSNLSLSARHDAIILRVSSPSAAMRSCCFLLSVPAVFHDSFVRLFIRVSIGDKVIFDSTADAKPVAFKLGQRPFQNVLCEGVEQGIKGMKTGGKRRLLVPKNLAPPGVDVPDGVSLVYDVEVKEVLPGYF